MPYIIAILLLIIVLSNEKSRTLLIGLTGLSLLLAFLAAIGLLVWYVYVSGPIFGLGLPELIVIMMLILIIGKLPAIGKGLSEAIKNFKKAYSGKDEI